LDAPVVGRAVGTGPAERGQNGVAGAVGNSRVERGQRVAAQAATVSPEVAPQKRRFYIICRTHNTEKFWSADKK